MTSKFPSVLSLDRWPFDWEWLPQPAYLVGGAVRDALLGRVSEYLDLDFVLLSSAVKTARKIADRAQAGFVLLDAKRQIARVVFENATADFAQAEGGSLTTDLQRRDFTVNAIAYNPWTEEIIDPLQGQADLQANLLRMVSAENLQDDPLRLLRAYRQAAQLGFTIAPDTLEALQKFAPLLSQIAAERVRTELGYLLKNPQGLPWMSRAWKDGLLSIWFPTAGDRLDRLMRVEAAAASLVEIWPPLAGELSDLVRDTIKTPLLAIAKLACLVNPDPAIATQELMALKYSNVEVKGTIALLNAGSKLVENSISNLSLREQYLLFRDAGKFFPALAVFAAASGIPIPEISLLLKRYFDPSDRVAHPLPLLSGNDLMDELNLPRSPLIGELLLEIQVAQAEGKISNREEALKLAVQLTLEARS